MILLPGNGYTGAATFVSGGSAAALAGVTNPDGSTDNLVFDVHQYLDSDGSGTTASCVKTSDVFAPLLTWLKDSKRQALLSETGGGSDDASCITNVCEVLDFLNTNSDQFLGYVGWAAGSFASSYVLSLVPDGDTDVPLMEKCFAAKFGGGAGTAPASPVSSSPATAPTTSAAVVAPSSTSAAVIAPSSSASSPAPVVPSSSAPAPIAPTSTPASPPIATSAPVLVQPPKPTSTTTPPYGLGPQKPGGTTTTSSPSEAGDEQDDCEAEFEDVLAVRTVVSRNGRARLSYEDEI